MTGVPTSIYHYCITVAIQAAQGAQAVQAALLGYKTRKRGMTEGAERAWGMRIAVQVPQAKDGIVYSYSAGGVARQNECSGNEWDGIFVLEQAQPRLEENVCMDNKVRHLPCRDRRPGPGGQRLLRQLHSRH